MGNIASIGSKPTASTASAGARATKINSKIPSLGVPRVSGISSPSSHPGVLDRPRTRIMSNGVPCELRSTSTLTIRSTGATIAGRSSAEPWAPVSGWTLLGAPGRASVAACASATLLPSNANPALNKAARAPLCLFIAFSLELQFPACGISLQTQALRITQGRAIPQAVGYCTTVEPIERIQYQVDRHHVSQAAK